MAQNNPDDLADALARLAGGDVAPSEHTPSAPPPPAARPAVRPTPPATAPRPGLRPPPAVARPAAPAAPAPPAPRPQRPSAPSIARPAAPPPNLTPPEPPPPAADVVDDDDAVIVPAPDASVFAKRVLPYTSAAARATITRRKQITFRQTLIPVLLTMGVLLIGFGLTPLALGADSVAAALPSWVSPTLLGLGLTMLVLAVLNMLSVRTLLLAAAAPGGR